MGDHQVRQNQEAVGAAEPTLQGDQVVEGVGVLQGQLSLVPEEAEEVVKGHHDPGEAEAEELRVPRYLVEEGER